MNLFSINISLIIKYTISLFVLGMFLIAQSYHPETKWGIITNNNFIIRFSLDCQSEAEQLSKTSEQMINQFNQYLSNIDYKKKINITITDYSDQGNGSADYAIDLITIIKKSLYRNNFLLRQKRDWLKNVLAHELAHIITLDYIFHHYPDIFSGVSISLQTKNIKNTSIQASTIIPHQYIPYFIAEGLAQYYAYRLGADEYDANRIMHLKSFLQYNKDINFYNLDNFRGKGAYEAELLYNIGFYFFIYLEKKWSSKKIDDFLEFLNSSHYLNFYKAYKIYFNSDVETDYIKMLKDFKKQYIKNITNDNIFNNEIDIIKKNNIKTASMKYQHNQKFEMVIANHNNEDYYNTEIFYKNIKSKKIYNFRIKECIDAVLQDDNIYFLTLADSRYQYAELYKLNCFNNKKTKINNFARIDGISAYQNDKLLVYSTNILYEYDIKNNIFSHIYSFPLDTEITSAAGDEQIFVSLFLKKNQTTEIYSLKKNISNIYNYKPEQITFNNSQERDLYFKNNILYFSADREGINNIFSFDINNKQFFQHTETDTGIFFPFVNNNQIFYSYFTCQGTRVHKTSITKNEILFNNKTNIYDLIHSAYKLQVMPEIKKVNKINKPKIGFNFKFIEKKVDLSIGLNLQDIMGYHSFSIEGTTGSLIDLQLSYQNKFFPLNFELICGYMSRKNSTLLQVGPFIFVFLDTYNTIYGGIFEEILFFDGNNYLFFDQLYINYQIKPDLALEYFIPGFTYYKKSQSSSMLIEKYIYSATFANQHYKYYNDLFYIPHSLFLYLITIHGVQLKYDKVLDSYFPEIDSNTGKQLSFLNEKIKMIKYLSYELYSEYTFDFSKIFFPYLALEAGYKAYSNLPEFELFYPGNTPRGSFSDIDDTFYGNSSLILHIGSYINVLKNKNAGLPLWHYDRLDLNYEFQAGYITDSLKHLFHYRYLLGKSIIGLSISGSSFYNFDSAVNISVHFLHDQLFINDLFYRDPSFYINFALSY